MHLCRYMFPVRMLCCLCMICPNCACEEIMFRFKVALSDIFTSIEEELSDHDDCGRMTFQ